MSYLSQFGGGAARRIAQIVNEWSSGVPITPQTMSIVRGARAAQVAATGTSGQLQTVLSVTGAGVLNFAGIVSTHPTTQTFRIRVTLDGTVAVDASLSLVQYQGACGVGAVSAPIDNTLPASAVTVGMVPDPAPFSNSCLVEFSTSLASAGVVVGRAFTNYRTYL